MPGEKIEGLSIDLDLDSAKVDRGLKGLKDNLRTVNSEMKSNMSAFDRSDRSIGKYETRLQGLNKKLGVQKQVTAEAKTEYEKMVAEHGEGSIQAEKAAREYNNQAASLNNLERYVEGATKELEKMKEEQRIANSRWTKMGDKLDKTGDKMKAFGGKMSTAGKAWTKGVTLPLLGIGTAAVAAANKTADFADSVLRNAEQVGVGTDAYQELNYALQTLGLDDAGVEKTLGRLNTRMGEAKEGSDKYLKALDNVGISQNDLENDVYSTDEAFMKIIESLQNIDDKQERASKASEIFGTRMSRRLLPAIEGGTEELEALRKEAQETGTVMSGDSLKSAQEYKFEMDKLKEEFKAVFREMGIKLIPILRTKFVPMIEKKVIPALKSGVDKIVDLVDWFSGLDDSTKKNIKRLGLFVIAGGPVLSVLGKMTSGFGGVVKGAGKLSTALGRASGRGLLGGLSGLGKAGVAGLAITGVAALTIGVGKLKKKIDESKEANFELSESLTDQASDLENSTEAFDRLSDKSKLSNDQLARMHELNDLISESSNFDEIEAMKDEYSKLAKESGLSNEQLKELNELNQQISESSNPDEIEDLKEEYKKLAKESGLSKDQLSKLNELNQKISESSNPGDISDLKEEYKDLAEESGLSKKEIKELFDANDDIIDQAPNVQQSVSDTGTKFVENTDAVNDYIQSLYEASRVELEAERAKQLEQEKDLRDKLKNQQDNYTKAEQELQYLLEGQKMTKDEIWDRQEEINDLYYNGNKTEAEKAELMREHGALQDALSDNLADEIDKRLDSLETQDEEIEKTEQKLEKIEAMDDDYANILLKQAGINEEGEKGLEQLDKSISKHKKERDELIAKKEETGILSEKDRERLDTIQDTILKQEDAKSKIRDKLGLYTDENDLLDNQMGQLIDNNRISKDGLKTEEERTKEAGKDVSKEIKIFSSGMDAVNKMASKPVNKTVNLVGKGMSTIRRSFEMLGYATGTDDHPGGPAVMGDGTGSNSGSELVNLPGGKSFFSANKPTLYPNLPKGTEVISAKNTKRMLQGVRHYAEGTRNSEFARLIALNAKRKSEPQGNVSKEKDYTQDLLDATLKQNQQVIKTNQLLLQILRKDDDTTLDGKSIQKNIDHRLAMEWRW